MTSSMLNICVPFIYIAFSTHLKPLYDPQRETKKEKSQDISTAQPKSIFGDQSRSLERSLSPHNAFR